jgi:uncharacterized membrane protein
MLYTVWREVFVDDKKVEGMILGVIGLLFLLYPVVRSFYRIIVPPPPSEYYYSPRFAGAFMGMLFLNILGVIFVGLSKLRLKHSTVFGALFIAAGLLNFYVWSGTFSFSGLSNLLVNAPSIITILIGVSLIVPLRQVAR